MNAFIALIPAFTWSFAALFDKILVSKYVRDGITAGIFTNLFSGILALLLILVFPLYPLPLSLCLFLLLIGVIWGWNRLCWVKAMSMEEASRIVAISQMSPILILFGSVLFFGEILAAADLAAFVLIFIGVFWISIKKIHGAFHFTPAIWWMILNATLFTITTLLLKTTTINDWFSALFWLNFGFALGSLPFLAFKLKDAKQTILRYPLQITAILLAINSGTIVGRAAYFISLKSLPAAIVSALAATQGVIVFLLTLFFTFYFPSILREDYHLSTIFGKLGALVLIVLGISLLHLG